MLFRIGAQEAHINKGIANRTYKAFMLVSSGCLLNALAIYYAYTIALKSYEFDYDPQTKIGSIVCYQNRIVYVTEIILCFLTIIKDIFFVVVYNDKAESSA
jgi:hypothetical protein